MFAVSRLLLAHHCCSLTLLLFSQGSFFVSFCRIFSLSVVLFVFLVAGVFFKVAAHFTSLDHLGATASFKPVTLMSFNWTL